MEKRWSIWIDIEGFGVIYGKSREQALSALSHLMDALYRTATNVYAESPNRLFIHQFGDGFVIVSDFPETSAERPLAMAITLMRHMISLQVATKVAISAGDFSDVLGRYPDAIQEAVTGDGRTFKVGEGLMSVIPVMGMALISPYKLSNKKTGALLLLDTAPFSNIPEGIKSSSSEPMTIDWVHSDLPLIKEICDKAGFHGYDAPTTAKHLTAYIEMNTGLPKEWQENTLKAAGLSI